MTTPRKRKKHRRSLRPKWLILAGILVLTSSFYIGHVFTTVNQNKDVFASDIYINQTPIGGLTYSEAEAKIQETYINTFLNQVITLTHPNTQVPLHLNYEQLGVTYPLGNLLDEAYSSSHEGSFFTRYKRYKTGITDSLYLTLLPTIDEAKVKTVVAESMEHFYKAPIDATMKRNKGSFIFTNEVEGYKLDVDTLTQQLVAALKDNTSIELSVPLLPVKPTYTVSYLKELQTPLASFTTSYNNADTARNENIRLASEKINKLLMPNEKFMFSKQLEPITSAAGYKDAKVIANGGFTDGLGGGICQVSSTLYNAVIQTDLDIYMRRNHSLPVSYTPLGLDATYATNSVDFQFINNSGHPLYVESYIANNKVYVTLYGHKDFKPDYQAKFESVTEEVIEPGAPKYEDDPTLPVGTEVQKSAGKSGYKVVVYKHYYKDGKLAKKEKLNTSTYKSQAPIIRRGTKVVAPPTPEIVPPITESP